MHFQKFQADTIFNGYQFLSSNKVLITDDKGMVQAIVDEQDAGDDILKIKGIISPGFINCHCHLELSHMKGLIPEKTGLVDFVFAVVTQRHFAEEEIVSAIEKAEKEMRSNGIVAVGDICNNMLSIPQKKQANLAYHNFIEVSGWLPDIAEQRMSKSRENFEKFAELSPSSMVPHAPYSVSEKLWKVLKPHYNNKVVSIHNQETSFEDDLFLHRTGDFIRMYEMMKLDTSFYQPSGKSSLQTYFHHLNQAGHIILVHNTFTRQGDIDFIKTTDRFGDTSFCICINANLYIEDHVPPIDLFRENKCRIVLGTDSLASNHSLSLLDEMKTIQHHFPHIPLQEMLQWATINGAEALQMSSRVGSFEKGKVPGIVQIENMENNRISNLTIIKRLL